MSQPLFELHGAGYNNRGGQLMLRTTAARLRERGAAVCMESLPGDRVDDGILPLFPSVRPVPQAKPVAVFFRLSRLVGRVLPPSTSYARRRDPRGLVDISGYAFGDTWGARRAANFADRCRYYKKQKKPVVLLPQMLGPFEDPAVGRAFREVVELADRIYARDTLSLEAVRALGGADRSTVRLAPDLTIFLADHPEPADDGGAPYACVVPNMRVLDSGRHKDAWRPVYMDRLEAACRRMQERGLAVQVVVHDASGDDRQLAEELVGRVPGATLVTDPDPLVLKSVLGGAQVVVGSRFHALVGALSMGVPAVALGWAHKYRMLLSDFGLPDCIHGPSDPEGHLLELVDRLVDEGAAARVTIQEFLDRMRPQNQAMWDDVFELLGV